ncbi:hypothetical protein BVRB_5g105750 [Beta vulgaris subsp. vulgaris]|uniref:Uncharacterized protein n=1 Tax=Beta vulgaris subsp. vulgaris TaxID=3555 RepID=A0A0J8F701_BETVV|nr:hypothetical protein BVRB_5g105750 [Beta vulgaris subsp. vulgaris]
MQSPLATRLTLEALGLIRSGASLSKCHQHNINPKQHVKQK